MNAKKALVAMLFVGLIGVTSVGCVPTDQYFYTDGGYYYGPAVPQYNSSGYYYNQSGPVHFYRGQNSYQGPAIHRNRARGRNQPRRRVTGTAVNRAGPRPALRRNNTGSRRISRPTPTRNVSRRAPRASRPQVNVRRINTVSRPTARVSRPQVNVRRINTVSRPTVARNQNVGNNRSRSTSGNQNRRRR